MDWACGEIHIKTATRHVNRVQAASHDQLTLMGRADRTTKVRAMFVHPSQIADILRRHPEILKARLVVSGEMRQDLMTLHCEVADTASSASAAIVDSIRDITKLRGAVNLVAPGSLANDGKVIEDARSYK